MSLRTKIIIGGVALALVAGAALFLWGDYRRQHQDAQDALQARERAEKDRELALASLKAKEAELGALSAELSEWQSRPPVVVEKWRTRIERQGVPADCQECFRNHALRRSFTDREHDLVVDVPDVLMGDTAHVEIDLVKLCKPALDATVCPPIPRDALLRHGPWAALTGGYANGGAVEGRLETWPIEIGRGRFTVQIGGYGQLTLQPSGDALGHAALGVRLELR